MIFENEEEYPVLGELILFTYLHDDTLCKTEPNEILERFLFDCWRTEMKKRFGYYYMHEVMRRLKDMIVKGEVSIEEVGMIEMDEGEFYGHDQ